MDATFTYETYTIFNLLTHYSISYKISTNTKSTFDVISYFVYLDHIILTSYKQRISSFKKEYKEHITFVILCLLQ